MKKFDLSIYKSSQPYFDLLDTYIKEQGIRKEAFLLEVGVTPSSYRKCRKGELNIGFEIVEKISNHFSLKVPDDIFLDKLEKFINKIYKDIYYKNFKSYKQDLEFIDELLNENYVIFPLFKLLKIFMIAASNDDIFKIQKNNKELYEEVAKYELFFNHGLYELFEIVYLVFTDSISSNHWIKNYKNGMAYFVLATRSYLEFRYIETLFYGEKCKKLLNEDGNINRLFYLNNTLMSSLMFVENYEECYELASNQLASLESIDYKESFHFDNCRKYRIVSMLGIREYKKIKDEYIDNSDVTLTEIVCILTAIYSLNKNDKENKFKEYDKYYEELEVDTLPLEYSDPIKLVDQMLKGKIKVKGSIMFLRKYEIMTHFEKIFQNIVLG